MLDARLLLLTIVTLAFVLLPRAAAEQPQTHRETVIVTGAYEPVPVEEADRSVGVLPIRGQELLSNTLADFLRLDPSLDLRARAPNGLQSDLSIRGGSFGQTLVLLDGQRLNDAQSGHHNMDIPVPLEAVQRIEVLRGAGSTLYGSDATGGVVNIITKPPAAGEFRLRTALGNFGVNQQRGSLGFLAGRLTEHITFSRDFSSGFRPNRDYRNLSFGSSTSLDTPIGASTIVLAYNDRPFGADQFYGNFNSWENTKTWFASARQALGEKTEASFAFRRHSDLFVLYRDRPEVFANHHAVESYQAAVRRREPVGDNAHFYYGIEGYHDSIISNNLGNHSRGRGAGYVAFDIRALRRFSLTVGAREEIYGTASSQFSPSVSGGLWINSRLKLRASASRAFRLPSYTDLYYHDPANLGSPGLRPERAWSYDGGLDWNAGGSLRGELVLFHRREQDGIDYTRRSPTDIWRATNIHRLRFTGVEAGVRARVARDHQIDLRYTGLKGAQASLDSLQSKYVFNYPTHSAVASWQATFPRGFLARTRIGALQRIDREPYALWDVYLAQSSHRVRPFVQFTNVTNTSYQEILGVVMPGRSVVGGVEIAIFGSRAK
ncbi:MAG: TonB-dependent receptor plug domain-containing protein [Bryobacteraceae bacterium]